MKFLSYFYLFFLLFLLLDLSIFRKGRFWSWLIWFLFNFLAMLLLLFCPVLHITQEIIHSHDVPSSGPLSVLILGVNYKNIKILFIYSFIFLLKMVLTKNAGRNNTGSGNIRSKLFSTLSSHIVFLTYVSWIIWAFW